MTMSRWIRTLGTMLATSSLGLAGVAQAQSFTVAVVPDTQNYSDVTLAEPRGEDAFAREMQYLADQREAKAIVFVAFVGDIVQHGDGRFRIPATDTAPARIMDTRAE